MNDNPLLEKSLLFAARIVNLYKYLKKEKHETIISKQIIRSGTSIGANANEAVVVFLLMGSGFETTRVRRKPSNPAISTKCAPANRRG